MMLSVRASPVSSGRDAQCSMSISRDLTRSVAGTLRLKLTTTLRQLTASLHPYPCLPGTTTGGARGAGNETTETKIGTGTEIGTVIHAAGAAAPAVQNGVVPTRGGQVCTINLHPPILIGTNDVIILIADRRDHGRDRDDDRRDRDPRESRRRDERDRRDTGRKDGEKDRGRYDRDRRESDKGRDAERDDDERGGERKARADSESQDTRKSSQSQGSTSSLWAYQN